MADSGIYNIFKANLMNKEVDLDTDVIKVALYDGTHAFTASDTVYTTSNEITGAGYTAGGATLANTTVSGTTTVAFDADDAAWSDATFTAYGAVIYDTSVSNNLICTIDFGGAKTVADGTFTIQWDASGIISLA